MDCESDTTFDHEENLIARGARLQCGADLPARARLVQVGAGAVERQGNQFDLLARQNANVFASADSQ
jgi:hypothetical protein